MSEESSDFFVQLVLSTKPGSWQSHKTLANTSSHTMVRCTAFLFRRLYAYHPHEAKEAFNAAH